MSWDTIISVMVLPLDCIAYNCFDRPRFSVYVCVSVCSSMYAYVPYVYSAQNQMTWVRSVLTVTAVVDQ